MKMVIAMIISDCKLLTLTNIVELLRIDCKKKLDTIIAENQSAELLRK